LPRNASTSEGTVSDMAKKSKKSKKEKKGKKK
jgi:hypothetical protein